MVNLFQNKKFLFTLILIASCFGILGAGEEIFASEYRCDNNSMNYGGKSVNDGMTANDWCAGSRDDCDNENDYDYAFCVENNEKLVRFGCKKGWAGTCDCNLNLFEVKDCPNGCVNGKCKTVSTPPVTACESKDDQICCDIGDCSSVVTSGPTNCTSGICCQKEYWNCESVNTQECVDINKCIDSFTVVPSDPNYCSGNLVCVKKGTCITEITACDCKSSCTSWVTNSECGEKGCKSSEKHQIRSCTWNGCKSGDCNIKQCKYFSDCKTTTAPNPCSWINIGCNPDDECDNQEAEICGPNTCTGVCNDNGIPKSKGKIRCVSGSDCGGGGEVPPGGNVQKPPVPGGAVRFENPLSTSSFETLIIGIINWILTIVVSLAILFLIIGGLMYITSAGDEERIKKAKNIILYAVIGLGVVILSWSIITELKDILGVQ